MFKALKIKFNGSKSDCCSVTIQPVEEVEEKTSVDEECCDVTIESKKSCCS